MTASNVRVMISAVVLVSVGLGLSGCGRKGELDPPSPAAAPQGQAGTAKPAQKHFLLDPLL
ncbi:lipoprotein [Allorhizobium sp. BGMRC 0089]|uniref:LPS translocon maturation chaperone LptM n=1 Tax=Allorhizobium sonneratiae TaxID=2934936 RepID=UPI0020344B86|nr:lipoprotein [Allorhizobium sonneratiae]MCM2293473.1 lipoprotein [Allorhizobium sonneratiae]